MATTSIWGNNMRSYAIEHTPAKGMNTLFVRGIPTAEDILKTVTASQSYYEVEKHIEHIYCGVENSFQPDSEDYWRAWESVLQELLNTGLWVSLEFDVKYAEEFHESGLSENRRFIPIISVPLPYIELFNYNTILRISDTPNKKLDPTNPGVWSHSLHELMNKESFTSFDQFN
jgi:hypothetical protein